MTDRQGQRIHAIVYSNDSREELGERIVMLEDENAKLRDALRALIIGTNAEVCAVMDYRMGYPDCEECSMCRDRENCTMTDAMRLLGCDIYGEPIRIRGTDGSGGQK